MGGYPFAEKTAGNDKPSRSCGSFGLVLGFLVNESRNEESQPEDGCEFPRFAQERF
jgi:hypothetical protein